MERKRRPHLSRKAPRAGDSRRTVVDLPLEKADYSKAKRAVGRLSEAVAKCENLSRMWDGAASVRRVEALKKDARGLEGGIGGIQRDIGELKREIGGLKQQIGGLEQLVKEIKISLVNASTEEGSRKGAEEPAAVSSPGWRF